MEPRSHVQPSLRGSVDFRVVTVGLSADETATLSESLLSLGSVALLNMERWSDLAGNIPAGTIDLLVADESAGQPLTRALGWVDRHWPRCLNVVLAENNENEVAARAKGALFFTHPIHHGQWDAVIEGVRQLRKAATA